MYNNCNRNCSHCPYIVRSTALTLTNNILTITIPEQPYYNNSIYCLVITQTLPVGVASNTRVVVQIGGTTVALITPDGHNVYADQLVCRRRLKIRVAADAGNFVVCNGLGCTHNFFPEVLAYTPTVTTAESEVEALSIKQKGVK